MIESATLRAHVLDAERRAGAAGVGAVLLDLAAGARSVASLLRRAALVGPGGEAGGERAHGGRRRMDVVANALLLDALARGGHVAAVASAELPEPHRVPGAGDARLLVAMAPLDGSPDLDANVAAGSVFSVLRAPEGAPAGAAPFLQPGARQACAAYALYGPSTVLVVALGGEVNGFTLDPATGEFVLSHARLRVPEEACEYAIDASSARHWEAPIRRYVDECVAGRAGVRAADFGMRWAGAAVADVHRVLLRGGTFLSPREDRDPDRPGKLRLLFEAAPLALVIEQAGGAASTGRARLLEVVPRRLHERVPALLGSRREVERLAGYHAERDGGPDRPFTSPLFSARTLLRDW